MGTHSDRAAHFTRSDRRDSTAERDIQTFYFNIWKKGGDFD